MYTENELLDKKPRELLEIILKLQDNLLSSKKLLGAVQIPDKVGEQIIRTILDHELSTMDKIRVVLETIGD
jgi:hypothetical protein